MMNGIKHALELLLYKKIEKKNIINIHLMYTNNMRTNTCQYTNGVSCQCAVQIIGYLVPHLILSEPRVPDSGM